MCFLDDCYYREEIMPTKKTEITAAQVKRLKQRAKKYQNKSNIGLSKAQDYIAREEGYPNWKAISKLAKETLKASAFIPAPSVPNLTKEEQLDLYEVNERTGDLTKELKLKVSENREHLVKNGVEFSIFEPTQTGLKKAILDATHPVRLHFEHEEFHNYDNQLQGPDYKVIKQAFFVDNTAQIETKMSLYRPKTKKGDPRMWFKNLASFASAGDQVATIILDDAAYLLNLSSIQDQDFINNTPIFTLINHYIKSNSAVSEELLAKLQDLATKPIPAIMEGDTAIGMSIEAALGIPANSDKAPDYKGIELKSGRGTKNRTTIFAQVANWDISPCKSSAQILDKYGYERGDDFKLYCTVKSNTANSQGLQFKTDKESNDLIEFHSSGDEVARWKEATLINRLQEKHAETFWIKAKSVVIDNKEHFQLESITHTKSPVLSQFIPLIESGVITMDHLIKRKGGPKPRVSEKGPLFKIDKKNLGLLFPKPINYNLTELI